MTKQLLCLALGIAVGAAGLALAQHDTNDKAPGKARFKPLLEQELKDMLNGKQGKIVVLELTSAPGSASRPHRHPGPVVGYVLEGELEVAVDDGPVKVYKKGEAWFEPGRALHRVNRNPSKTKPAGFLAFMLMTAEDKHLVLPAKE
jgi:quercetin dioxygenase-like cupin family protein